MTTKGYAGPEVERVYTRARDLCEQLGEPFELFVVLMGLSRVYVVRGELQTGRELAEHLMRLAQNVQDPALFLEAHEVLGWPLLWLGEVASAHKHVEQGIALYNPQQHRSYAFRYWHDPGMACQSIAAWTLWFLGYPDQALQRSREALTLARELSHPFSLAAALSFAGLLHQLRREEQITQERAEAAMALSMEAEFPVWVAMAATLCGWARAEEGQGEEGIAQLRQGLAAWRAMGAETISTWYLAMLAEAYGRTGQAEEGLIALAEALVTVDKNGERFYEAEVYRLKGELSLKSRQVEDKSQTSQGKSGVRSPKSEAEECFLKAIEIARRQQAKSLELRAVMSLSRLWQSQGKNDEARQMLAEIYGWFTEGFDTADLKEAKALLEELSE
jgi:predicted ATPase